MWRKGTPMRSLALALVSLVVIGTHAGAQQTEPVAITRFIGTWVGTQAWAIESPPPGARHDQPVTLAVAMTDGKVTGSLTPFLGSEEGATFVDVKLVGDELHATAIVGRPRAAGARGRAPSGWKESTQVTFIFRNLDLNMSGTADVMLGEVPWMKLEYELSRKRSRY